MEAATINGQLERQLRELIAKQELHDLVARLHRALDQLDDEVICDTFAPGFRYGVRVGMTAQEFATHVRKMHRECFGPTGLKLKSTQHAIANEIFEINGDEATGEYLTHFRGVTVDGVLVQMLVRYADRFVRTESRWRIAERDVVVEWGSPELEAFTTQLRSSPE
ncbi:MAG: nuclear transport factor 2 family protein [Microbacterium sp.]